MTEIPTTVYLNEAPGSVLGFNAISRAKLRAAISFNLPVPTGTRPHQTAVAAALENIFEELNVDDPTATWAQQYRLAGNRSLSVGDVVQIGETAWAVASSGWSPVHADDLTAAINR